MISELTLDFSNVIGQLIVVLPVVSTIAGVASAYLKLTINASIVNAKVEILDTVRREFALTSIVTTQITDLQRQIGETKERISRLESEQ